MNPQNPKFVLVAIALLFFTPLIIAMLMQSRWWEFEPSRFSNRGTLVEPAVNAGLADLDIQHPGPDAGLPHASRWVILYPVSTPCEAACRRVAASLRQIHMASGRHRDRLSVVLLAPRPLALAKVRDLVNIYPEFVIAVDAAGTVSGIFPDLAGGDVGSGFGDGRAFLLDPTGNIILGYASGFDPDDINKDLRHLLTWSGQDKSP